MESTSSLRREIPVYICCLASSSLSARNSGLCSRSRYMSNTASKSPFRQFSEMRGRVRLIVGFDLGGTRFEEVVHLVAGFGLGAAGAPDVAVEIGQAGLVGSRFIDGAAANSCDRADQRQLMVGLKEDHHAVRQLNASRLLRRECRQRRRLESCSRLAPARR